METNPRYRHVLLVIGLCANVLALTHARGADSERPLGRIAFVRGGFADSGNRKIYLVNPDGSDLQPLTDDNDRPGEDRPSWSPDGTSIAYSARDRICVRDSDGGNLRVLTPERMEADAPTWSPDGSRIAFHGYGSDRTSSQIYTMNSDGTDVRQLTSLDCYNWIPSWCADGSVIVWESTITGDRDVFSISPAGKNLVNLSVSSGTDHAPKCSPDGKRIVFASGRGYGNLDVCVMDLDGTNVVNLTRSDSRDSEPTWSPEGEWIAFTRSDGSSPPMDICIMRADGSDVTVLTTNDQETDNWAPSWRP